MAMLTTSAAMPKCKKATGAKIIVHEDDAIMLTDTPAMILKMFGAKASPPADILVKDGDIISVGNVESQSYSYSGTFSRRD